jgi:sigma-B regulation protein RsbU (phosphoserine phosphatase)
MLDLIDDAQFEVGEIQLAPDDQVVFFTDGIVEARSPMGSWFEIGRLVELVSANRGLSAHALLEHIVLHARRFAGVDGFEDDVTMVLLRRRR